LERALKQNVAVRQSDCDASIKSSSDGCSSLIKFCNRFWFKRTEADYHLFDRPEMIETFPDAKIYAERHLGMTKSLMAIKA
jgi:hypothetical protein